VVEDGETGLLLQAPEVDAYVDAVVSLLAAPDRLAVMSAQATVRARRVFDRSVSSGRYAALYDTLTRAPTPTPASRAAVRP
jgi:glycosyltransferase involved in cell wall biosynthesis